MATSPNQSFLAQQVLDQNFTPQLSATITATTVTGSITFTPITGSVRQTFKITNTGSVGAYIGWGMTTATAVVATGTPAQFCDYIAAGAILTQDFTIINGVVDTLAFITASSTTVLQITCGFGQ